MASRIPSIRRVAQRAGVSTATVSNVLTGSRPVTPALAARVQAAVSELGYIADGGASRLRSRRSAVIGMLVPDIGNPFFANLAAAVEVLARRDRFDLLLASSGEDPAEQCDRMRALRAWRPAGLIVVPCDDAMTAGQLARDAGVPMVAVDRVPATGGAWAEAWGIDVVAVDNDLASRQVARHLFDLGHRRLLVLASQLAIGNVVERCAGIQAEAAARGPGVSVEILEAGFGLAASRAALGRRLSAPLLPTALFTLNGLATLAALEALTAQGLAVPEDIALVGFDDPAWMAVVSPPISAVRQPLAQMADVAWSRLRARIAGEGGPAQQIRLACSFEIRASSGPGRAMAADVAA